jgi:hypothetical protein
MAFSKKIGMYFILFPLVLFVIFNGIVFLFGQQIGDSVYLGFPIVFSESSHHAGTTNFSALNFIIDIVIFVAIATLIYFLRERKKK